MVSRPETTADASAKRWHFPRLVAVLIAGAHLTVLASFGVAQPLFDLLGKNAAFFAARASPPEEIVAFALAVTLALPLTLLGLELLAGLIHPLARIGVHLAAVGFLAAVLALYALASRTDIRAALLIPLAFLLGGVFAYAYGRIRTVRSFLTILSPAPFVFLGLFLFTGQVSKLVLPEDARAANVVVEEAAPVILVMFDEFPLVSLLRRDERIDRVRYPNFAALADDSIWFRNATAVSDFTNWAAPAVLSGEYPEHDQLPITSDYPHTVFTLLGATYDTKAFVPFPQLCPPSVCGETQAGPSNRARSLVSDLGVVYGHLLLPKDLRDRLPSLEGTWENFRGGQDEPEDDKPRENRRTKRQIAAALVASRDDRVQVFERFMKSLGAPRTRTLRVLHLLYPHYPWDRLPSGKYYNPQRRVVGMHRPDRPEQLVRQAWQRHLLQVGFTDRLLGQILRRLKQVGVYERALIIVTADHGASFRTGHYFRRFEPEAAADILYVPLLVKLPENEDGGTIDDSPVETIDVLPTIANVLGIELPWPLDGRSLLDGGSSRVHVLTKEGDVRSAPIDELESQRLALAKLQADIFGNGRERPGLFGPNAQLIGQPPGRYASVAAGGSRAQLDRPDDLRSVDLSAAEIPALLTGMVDTGFTESPVDLALSLNGRIVAVTHSFRPPGENQNHFAFVVPESAFKNGANEARVYWVQRDGATIRLAQLVCAGCD